MFRRFQALKKGIETIKRVAPSVGNKLGQKKVDLLKKMGKTQRTNPENFKKAGGDKLKKEILDAGTRVKKAEGGSTNDRSSAVDKAILKGVASGVYDMSDFKKYKKTGEIPGSKKRTEKALGGMLGFKKKDKKKDKSIKEKILPKKKKDRLEELRRELKAKGGPAGLGALGGVRNKGTKKSPDKKKRRESTEFEKVRFKLADKKMGKMSESDRKAIKNMTGKTASKVLRGIVTRKFKEAGNEAASAMGGYKRGGRAFGGGKK